MQTALDLLTEKLNINTTEGYLYIEKTNTQFKLYIIERGTGGCTFPDMEELASREISQGDDITTYLLDSEFQKEILAAKIHLAKSNSYFYDTVFKE